jgi:5-methylcytosine-specific restriction endonuclease McrA
MSRNEFTQKTKKAALKRSEMRCEAIGAMYGLEPGKRCVTDISGGVQFDHIVLDANSKDNSIENCAAVCIKCHRWKTANHDVPMAAKTVRQMEKHIGLKRPKQTIRSAPFQQSEKAAKREPKDLPELPRRQLYQRIEP